ncbi:hypothetical protein [Flavobacterium humi]|uniref:Uncharacterized protein n=1 Tax=Flavobacterium humi TaxID=2562683 RepID=A0A4Z0L6P1_9FLAO|nr:hypothetical protein [Flavobacterium humi]TGD56655.1 hypothetical protein E4635_14510 [Flavobacterium humi]
MERRLFVKNTTLLTSGILALSGSSLYASNEEKKSNIIDLSPVSTSKNTLLLKGMILDAATFQKIDVQKIDVQVKRNRFFATKQSIENVNGSYAILSGFTNNGKVYEKMNIRITANGYKPYEGCVYLTKDGCHVHSEEWAYNPAFKPEYCPKNNTEGNQTLSEFNFHLVKL